MARPFDHAARSTDELAGRIRSHAEEVGLALSEDDATALAGNLLTVLDAVAAAARSLKAPFDDALSGQVYSDDE